MTISITIIITNDMANYATLKAAIQQVIKTNGNNEITGALLQQSLLAMINALGSGYQYIGVATPSTDPGTPDQNVFYFAAQSGTYANFGSFTLASGEIAILKYNGSWQKETIANILTKGELIDSLPSNELSRNNQWITGNYYVYNTGVMTTSANFSALPPIDVSQYVGQTLNVNVYLATNGGAAICFTDSNDTFISNYRGIGIGSVTIPANAKWLKICNRSASMPNAETYFYIGDLIFAPVASQADVDSLTQQISELLNIFPLTEIAVTWTAGSYYDYQGVLQNNSNWASARIDVEQYRGGKMKFRVNSQNNSSAYALLLGNNTTIWSYQLDGVLVEYEFAIPQDAKYLLVSNRSATGPGSVYAPDMDYFQTIPEQLAQFDTARKAVTMLGQWGPWEKGFYYDQQGIKSVSANYNCLPAIDVSEFVGLSFEINVALPGGVAYAYVSFLDENNAVLLQNRPNGKWTGTVPSGAKTLLVCNRFQGGDPYNPRPYLFIEHAYSMPTLDELLDITVQRNNLTGKKITFLGDSITEGSGANPTAKRYSTVLSGYYGAIENNLGVAGTCLASGAVGHSDSSRFVERATVANLQGSDLIIIFGGTNDFSYDSKAIGDLFVETTITPVGRIGSKELTAPSDTDTFAGALHELINTVRANCPNVPIVLVTPLNRGNYTSERPSSKQSNVNGNFLYEFCDAIKTIGAFYSLPVCDMSKSELDFSNDAIATQYSADKLHPNNAGHEIIAKLLYRFIEDNVIL